MHVPLLCWVGVRTNSGAANSSPACRMARLAGLVCDHPWPLHFCQTWHALLLLLLLLLLSTLFPQPACLRCVHANPVVLIAWVMQAIVRKLHAMFPEDLGWLYPAAHKQEIISLETQIEIRLGANLRQVVNLTVFVLRFKFAYSHAATSCPMHYLRLTAYPTCARTHAVVCLHACARALCPCVCAGAGLHVPPRPQVAALFVALLLSWHEHHRGNLPACTH